MLVCILNSNNIIIISCSKIKKNKKRVRAQVVNKLMIKIYATK